MAPRANARAVGFRGLTATFPRSLRSVALLRRRQVDLAEQLALVVKLDAVLLVRPPARLGHECKRVLGARPARVLDEVRVLRRDLRTTDPETAQAAGVEHPPRAQLVVRVLEDAAEGPLVRRLRRLALGIQLAHPSLDLLRRPSLESQLRPHDDLPVAEVRMPVQETELGRAQPPGAFCGGHERTLEDLGEVAAVRARVHPDAAADRAGDGAGELERPEARVARAMEADCVRGAAAGTQDVAVDLHLRELAFEVKHERVHTFVGDEEVRPETDRRDREPPLRRPAQALLELGDGSRLCKLLRPSAGAEGRVPREFRANASSSNAPARSTSPAPSVSTVSPARAQAATRRTPSSRAGVQPSGIPGRTRASSSTS